MKFWCCKRERLEIIAVVWTVLFPLNQNDYKKSIVKVVIFGVNNT